MKSRHLRNDKTVQQLLYAVILLLIACLDAGAEDSGGGRRMISFTEYLLFPRIWVSVLAGIGGGLLLMTVKVRRRVRLLALSAVFIIFAVLPVFREAAGFFAKLAPHPSPLCAFAKPILFSMQEGQIIFPSVFAGVLAMIALLSIAGNKLFCGWVCPIGALQEIGYLCLPRVKKLRIPFAAANSVRIGLLILFVPILLGFGMYIYGYFNPFEILHWPLGTDFWTLYAWAVILIVVVVALFLYRPFCHIICPIGALTWFLEHISIARIRLRKERCNNCRVCVSKSPCSAVEAILAGKRARPDCYACGMCVAACPADALQFRMR